MYLFVLSLVSFVRDIMVIFSDSAGQTSGTALNNMPLIHAPTAAMHDSKACTHADAWDILNPCCNIVN